MSRIAGVFSSLREQGRQALIPFVTAGDPTAEVTLPLMHALVDAGNTVIVIEHNLDVIKTADWIVDLGPNGGDNGGRIVVEGTPETVAACEESYTGQYLERLLPPAQPERKSA